MARQNYKVYANLGVTRQSLAKFAVVLDTGAGSSFIRKSAISPKLWVHIRKNTQPTNIRDANGRRVSIEGIIDLVVELGTRTEVVQFKVNERVGTDVILGCDFCDKHVEAIRPRQREVELDDGTRVPIVKAMHARTQREILLPEYQVNEPARQRISDKIGVVKAKTRHPGHQNWVEVTSDRTGLILIAPSKTLYANHMCLTGTGDHQVQKNKKFSILIANFGKHPVKLYPQQVVAQVQDHPSRLLATTLTHGEQLGITDTWTKPKRAYRKRNTDKR